MKEPPRDCERCPRLAAFREANRRAQPCWHNSPVESFGPIDARLLIVGLAPGLRGANRTARPFTGDYAGDLLYATLGQAGFTCGHYAARADDGFRLVDCRVTNAVRCVPPQNKPTGAEMNACRPFLAAELAAMTKLQAIMCLGRIAHEAVIRTYGLRLVAWPFAHGAVHRLPNGPTLTDSYHCSRYNTNTGRLTAEMFTDVVQGVRARLNGGGPA